MGSSMKIAYHSDDFFGTHMNCALAEVNELEHMSKNIGSLHDKIRVLINLVNNLDYADLDDGKTIQFEFTGNRKKFKKTIKAIKKHHKEAQYDQNLNEMLHWVPEIITLGENIVRNSNINKDWQKEEWEIKMAEIENITHCYNDNIGHMKNLLDCLCETKHEEIDMNNFAFVLVSRHDVSNIQEKLDNLPSLEFSNYTNENLHNFGLVARNAEAIVNEYHEKENDSGAGK